MQVFPEKRGLVRSVLLLLTVLLCLVGVVGAIWLTRLGGTIGGGYLDLTATEAATIYDHPEEFVSTVRSVRSVVLQCAVTLGAAGTSGIRVHSLVLLCCGIAGLLPPDRRILRRAFIPLVISWLLSFGALRIGREWESVAATTAEQPVSPSAPDVLSELESGLAAVRLASISLSLLGLIFAVLFGIATVGAVRSLLAGRQGTRSVQE